MIKQFGTCGLKTVAILCLSALVAWSGCVVTGGKKDKNSIPRKERKGLAVLKFVNSTSGEKAEYFQPWEYGIAAMLTTDLEQTAMFNIVDRERLYDILAEQKLQSTVFFDQSTVVSIGKMVAAEYILSGTFVVVGDNLKMTAQVFSVEKGTQLGAVSADGITERFFGVEKALFGKISNTLRVILDEEKKKLIMAAIETTSVDASLNNYAGEMSLLKAEEMKKLGKKEETKILSNDAKLKFREALEADPNYERAKENLSRLVMAIPMTL